ncbi:hypothetical protein GCM10027572_11790 [Flexivirga lutea]
MLPTGYLGSDAGFIPAGTGPPSPWSIAIEDALVGMEDEPIGIRSIAVLEA